MDAKLLLAVWAHPDDEAFGPVGTMRLAHDRGWRTALVTATRGDAGSQDYAQLQPGQTLGDVREAELRAACAVLGVGELVVWRYQDGKLANVEPERLANDVLELMRELQPAVVVTFGPDGITGHPDHVAISAAATSAFFALQAEQNNQSKRRLYYTTIKPGITIEHRMGDTGASLPPTAVLDVGAYQDTKRNALECHASQRDDWEPQLANHDWLTVDRFARAFPPVAPGELVETTILDE